MQPIPMYLVCERCCYRNVVIPDQLKLISGKLRVCPLCGGHLNWESVNNSTIAKMLLVLKGAVGGLH